MDNIQWMTTEDIKDLYPIKESLLRRWLYDRKKNGLHVAVRKVGKRLLIRRDLMDEWIDSHKE